MGRRAFYAEGPLAERPPARRQGLMYEATDEGVVYIDDGSAWVPLRAAQEPAPRHIVWDQFVPGTLSARNPISVIANPVNAQVVLRYLEANLEQAPSTVDASNNLVLDVFGSIAGLAELPLDVSGQSRFTIDKESPVIVGAQTGLSLSTGTEGAMAGQFQATADLSIVSVAMRQGGPSGTNLSGIPTRFAILNADRSAYLAVTAWHDEAKTLADWNGPWELDQPVDLAALDKAWVGVELDGSGGWDTKYQNTYEGSIQHGGAALGTIASGTGAGTLLGAFDATHGSYLPAMRLYGRPTGIPIDGDINLALSSVGTPGSNPGADLNITLRAELPA